MKRLYPVKYPTLLFCLTVMALLILYGCEKDSSSGKIPTAPSDFDAVAISSNQIRLTWTDNAYNESGFKLECAAGGTSDFSEIVTQPPNSNSYVHGMLIKSTKYSYRISAFNDAGYSKFAADSAVTLESNIIIPAAPAIITATAISSTQILVTWMDNSDNEDGFRLEWRKTNAFSWTVANTGPNNTSFEINGLEPATPYRINVASFNVAGLSSYSTIITTTL